MSVEQLKECCICLNLFHGPGNNPEPFGSKGDRCCTDCDDRFVTPVRMLLGRKPMNDKLEQFLRGVAKYGNFVISQKKHMTAVHRKKIS